MEFRVTVLNEDEIRAKFYKLEKIVQPKIDKAINRGTESAKDYARMIVAVDTGELRTSIFSRLVTGGSEFGATAAHAFLVEHGTRFMDAQPFISVATERGKHRTVQLTKEAIDNALLEASLK